MIIPILGMFARLLSSDARQGSGEALDPGDLVLEGEARKASDIQRSILTLRLVPHTGEALSIVCSAKRTCISRSALTSGALFVVEASGEISVHALVLVHRCSPTSPFAPVGRSRAFPDGPLYRRGSGTVTPIRDYSLVGGLIAALPAVTRSPPCGTTYK
jgi:hypothetical protein